MSIFSQTGRIETYPLPKKKKAALPFTSCASCERFSEMAISVPFVLTLIRGNVHLSLVFHYEYRIIRRSPKASFDAAS